MIIYFFSTAIKSGSGSAPSIGTFIEFLRFLQVQLFQNCVDKVNDKESLDEEPFHKKDDIIERNDEQIIGLQNGLYIILITFSILFKQLLLALNLEHQFKTEHDRRIEIFSECGTEILQTCKSILANIKIKLQKKNHFKELLSPAQYKSSFQKFQQSQPIQPNASSKETISKNPHMNEEYIESEHMLMKTAELIDSITDELEFIQCHVSK